MTTEKTGDEEAAPRRRRRLPWPLRKRPARIGALLLILALIAEYLVVPELVDASRNLYLLGRISAGWVVAGVALEALSLYCYALMNRALLPGKSPPISRLFRIDLSAAAVAHVLPAGTVGSAGIGYTLFTAEGISGADTSVMMATKGIGSAVVLNVLLWLSLVISIPLAGFHPIYITVAAAGAVALGGFSALVLAFTLGRDWAARIVRAIGNAIPGVGGDRLANGVHRMSLSLVALGRDRRMLVRAIAWASANWLLDAASLWCFVAAFGRFANPVELFAAYGIGNVLGVIPITPAGLGVIDSVVPILLVSFGLTRSVATLGVLAWRLVNFWLPIPTGALAYVSLKMPRGARLKSIRRGFSELLARTPRADQSSSGGSASSGGSGDSRSHYGRHDGDLG
jgi:uncharacterized protein (TIRG00374 family)